MKTIKIVGLVVDKVQLNLYLADGSTYTDIKQGDPRLNSIVTKAVKEINEQGFSDISLEELKEENHFEEFEKKSSLVKFFKVAKSKLKELFASKVPEVVVGIKPEELTNDEDVCESNQEVVQTLEAVAEVIKHATPVSHSTYSPKDVHRQGNIREEHGGTNNSTADSNETHTLIAVVETENGPKVIPEMERIESQIKHSNSKNNPVGMENFLKRLGDVIEKRNHSVQDLLKFIERNDMPIANDGTFIAYKVLNKRDNGYVDVHSGNVTQWLGSYVHMDESMVDPNRRNECSNGLHIARRGYVGSFGGSACVLAKVAPEDVIAVPTYDANKIRVCGYHIVDVLTDAEYGQVRNNNPITNEKSGGLKLANVIAGNHIGRLVSVKIGGHKGTKLEITQHAQVEQKTQPVIKVEPVQALPNKVDEQIKAPMVDPKDVLKEEAKVIEQVLSKKEKAKQLYQAVQDGSQEAYNELLTLKKASKVGWDKLGIQEPVAPSQKPSKVEEQLKTKVEQAKKDKPMSKQAKQIAKPKFNGKPEAKKKDSPAIQMEELKKLKLDNDVAFQMLNIKKTSKKSWEYFGISKDQAELITLKGK